MAFTALARLTSSRSPIRSSTNWQTKDLRIQAVLPGATATDLWESAGLHYSKLPPEIVMSTEELVDAALVGLDQGELVTIPPLQDGEEWARFEAARRALSQRFGHSHPGPRYRAGGAAA